MSAHKMTSGVFQASLPPPPPPPPPPAPAPSSQPSSSFTFIAGSSFSPQLSSHHRHNHHQQECISHLTDLQSLAPSKTPIQERKQQLYRHQYQQEPESSNFESHQDSGFSQPQPEPHKSPSKLMQSEVSRSRHCASRLAGGTSTLFSSDSPSIASNEGYSTAHCLPTATPASGSAVAANYASPLRQFPLPSGPGKHPFQQNASSAAAHAHRCNKHRINARGSTTATAASAGTTNLKSTSFSTSSSFSAAAAVTAAVFENGQSPSSPVHSTFNGGTSVFDGSKKSRCILFSQIYLIAHVSITLCLSEIRGKKLKSVITMVPKYILIQIFLLQRIIISH